MNGGVDTMSVGAWLVLLAALLAPWIASAQEAQRARRLLQAIADYRPVDVSIGPPGLRIAGTYPLSHVRDAVARRAPELRRCYQDSLRSAPGTEGSVILRFRIGPRGRITGATLEPSTLGIPELARCVRQVVERAEMPPPADGAPIDVVLPLAFRVVSPLETPPRLDASGVARSSRARPPPQGILGSLRSNLGVRITIPSSQAAEATEAATPVARRIALEMSVRESLRPLEPQFQRCSFEPDRSVDLDAVLEAGGSVTFSLRDTRGATPQVGACVAAVAERVSRVDPAPGSGPWTIVARVILNSSVP